MVQGAPLDKLIMGIPFYGKSFTLANPTNDGVRAAVLGLGNAGPWSDEKGTLLYNELCPLRSTKDAKDRYEFFQDAPYIINGDQWITYDNER